MKVMKIALKFCAILLLIFIFINYLCYFYALITPKIKIKNVNSFYIYDTNDNLIFQGSGSKEWVNLNEISPNLINATISVEDKNYYNHKGFDFLRIARAIVKNIKSKDIVQGASTITQQYAKNLFLTFEQSWNRKWKEMWLTFEIETHYNKEEILEGYLNTINYGQGMYGIENASQYYFNKKANELSLSEATILAGIPNSPANYSPLANYNLSKKRQKTVLDRMVKNKYITVEEAEKAYNTDLSFYGKIDNLNLSTLMYYQDAVIKELQEIKEVPNNYLETGSLKIYTALDIKAQTILEKNINKNLANSKIQTNSIMMKPETGEIIALVGGRNYSDSQYNRATSSKRQPGSTIKTFLYYSAIENGFTASTTFLSQKTTFNLGNNQIYSPQNYNEKYANKEISLAAAIAYSDNIYAVKTHMFLGTNALIETAKKVGFKTKLKAVPSLPLGSNEVNIIEITAGYAALANNGYKINPHLIKEVKDIKNNTLYKNKNVKEKILDEKYIYILNDLLTTTYDSNLIEYNYPTCINISNRLTRKYAMKSGTTDYDAWIIGFNKDIVLSNWVGYDNNLPVTSTDSLNNKKIWAETMETYLKGKEKGWYDIPDNVVGVLVNPTNGKIATKSSKNKRILYYIKGTEPNIKDDNSLETTE